MAPGKIAYAAGFSLGLLAAFKAAGVTMTFPVIGGTALAAAGTLASFLVFPLAVFAIAAGATTYFRRRHFRNKSSAYMGAALAAAAAFSLLSYGIFPPAAAFLPFVAGAAVRAAVTAKRVSQNIARMTSLSANRL